MRIFLCHENTDLEKAEALRTALEAAGYEVLLSGETPGWQAQIDRCPHFIILLSEAAANSEACRAQWTYWLGKNHPISLLILLDTIAIPPDLASAQRINAAAMSTNALVQAVLVIMPPLAGKPDAAPRQQEAPAERVRGRTIPEEADKGIEREKAEEKEIIFGDMVEEEAEPEAAAEADDFDFLGLESDLDDAPADMAEPDVPAAALPDPKPESPAPPPASPPQQPHAPQPPPVFTEEEMQSAQKKGGLFSRGSGAPTRSARSADPAANTTAAGQPGGLTYEDLLQPPHFAAFYPEKVLPGKPYALMTFAFLEFVWNKVQEVAAGYSAMMGGRPASSAATGRLAVDVGSLVTFVPQIDGLTFSPVEQTITWRPPYQNATFLFTTPADLTHDLTGRILVYQGVMITGEIPITMRLETNPDAASTAPEKSDYLRKLEPIFASYSHRDTPVMEFFRRSRQETGQKMLVDVYDLRSGEHWADRLLEMIDESAIFQLFWSEHSARSQYCRQEWEHALALMDDRPRFIQPVWWDAPMPPPPPELADLHFQRINLPPVTKFQLAAAAVKRWLGINT